MQVVPVSAALVAWTNAWLAGHIGLDDAADAVEESYGPQMVAGLSDEDDEEIPLRRGLAHLRVEHLTRLRLALPATGDPLGLVGPPPLNSASIEAGEAALSEGDVRPPRARRRPEDRRGSSYVGIRWAVHAASPGMPDTPPLPEAEQQLTLAMRDATQTLLELDVPRWHPEAAETLAALRAGPHDEPPANLPPGYSPRAHRVAALAGRLALVLDIALSDEGGSVAASEMASRREALRDLDRAVRRARVAAYNSVAGAAT